MVNTFVIYLIYQAYIMRTRKQAQNYWHALTLDTIKNITTNNVEERIKTDGYPYKRLIRKIKIKIKRQYTPLE